MKTPRAPVRVPITRADAYSHDDAPNTPITPLAVTHLIVDVDVARVGAVTLAATTAGDGIDPYGFEFDLDPVEARRLAAEILSAADTTAADRP